MTFPQIHPMGGGNLLVPMMGFRARPRVNVTSYGVVAQWNTATTLSGLSVTARQGNPSVTLAASAGTLSLSGTTGLTFTVGDGTDDATMTFSGTAAAINAALEGMEYTSTRDYAPGAVTVTVQATDAQGQSSTRQVTVNVDSFTPDKLSGLLAAYDFTDDTKLFTDTGATTPAAVNDTVKALVPVFGSGTFTEATNGPTRVAGGLRFDGSNDLLRLETGDWSSVAGIVGARLSLDALPATSNTLWNMSDKDDTTSWLIGTLGTSAGNTRFCYQQTNGGAGTDSLNGSTTLAIDTPYTVLWSSSDTAIAIEVNGAAETLSVGSGSNNGDWSAAVDTVDVVSLGALITSNNPNGQSHSRPVYRRLVFYSQDTSSADKALLRQWLAA